uniref:Uncharacterized protein n=1 Tax=Arundo donax TaxID=35708 RepID=A0A0A9FEG2_ARUDO
MHHPWLAAARSLTPAISPLLDEWNTMVEPVCTEERCRWSPT